MELAGLTFGLVGFGRIGRAVARVAQAMGMNVIAYDVTRPADGSDHVRFVTLPELFRESDAITSTAL